MRTLIEITVRGVHVNSYYRIIIVPTACNVMHVNYTSHNHKIGSLINEYFHRGIWWYQNVSQQTYIHVNSLY